MFKTQLEQKAEVTDFVTKFHILMTFLWSLRVYYTQYEINTVVHLRQIFMENLGAQETGKKKFLCCYPVLYFHFLLPVVYIHDSE